MSVVVGPPHFAGARLNGAYFWRREPSFLGLRGHGGVFVFFGTFDKLGSLGSGFLTLLILPPLKTDSGREATGSEIGGKICLADPGLL